jgi:hypothetical protein
LLRDDIETFIAHGASPTDLFQLLRRCIEYGTSEGLTCVRRLFEDDYGGFTFNVQLKASAGSTLLIWREAGLDALFDAVRLDPTFKNLTIGVPIFTYVAANLKLPSLFLPDSSITESI